jgi:hypothetical protein
MANNFALMVEVPSNSNRKRRIVTSFIAILLVGIIWEAMFWYHAVLVHQQGREAYIHSRQQAFDRIYAVDPHTWSINFYIHAFLAAAALAASTIVTYELVRFGVGKLIGPTESKKIQT